MNTAINTLTLHITPLTSKADILGYIDAHGTYHPSQFRILFEHGGRLYIYGYESAHPGVIAILKAAFAHSRYEFPDGWSVPAHPDFSPLVVSEIDPR